jgi:hypothetical protein
MKLGKYREEEPDAPAGTPMGVQVLAFLCGIVVVHLGLKSIRQDYRIIAKTTRLESYAETPGKMLQIKIRRDSLGTEDDTYPDVLYEYFVDGKSIWGWRLSLEDEAKPRSYWTARLEGYAVGARVPVYFDPAQPKESVLEKKHDGLSRTWLKMAVGGGFVLVGSLLALLPAIGWIRKGLAPKI